MQQQPSGRRPPVYSSPTPPVFRPAPVAGGRRWVVLGVAIVALLAVLGVVGYLMVRPSQPSAAKAPAGQSELQFSGLYQPQGVLADGNGTVYVSDFNNRVVKLAEGSNDQVVLPFCGLSYPEGLAVDSGGNVYVADRGSNPVVRLTPG